MNATQIIALLIQISIMLVTFSFGLKAHWSDATYFFRKPVELLRAFLVMNVAMLLFAIFLAESFDLLPAVKLALIVLALSPVPPFLPGKQFKAGGEGAYVYGLLVGMSVLAIVAVPVLVVVVGKVFNVETHVAPSIVAKALLGSVLVPLAAGIGLRMWKPVFAERASKWVSLTGNIILLMGVVLILFGAWRGMFSLVGSGAVFAIAAFAAVGLVAGHWLGGPDPENRTSLALATASRHPAVALAIAHATFPDEKRVFAAVLLYLFVANIIAIPYLKWRKRHPGVPHESGRKRRWKHRPA